MKIDWFPVATVSIERQRDKERKRQRDKKSKGRREVLSLEGCTVSNARGCVPKHTMGVLRIRLILLNVPYTVIYSPPYIYIHK